MKIGFRKLIIISVFLMYFITLTTILIFLNIFYQKNLEKKFIDENNFAVTVVENIIQTKKDEIALDARKTIRDPSTRIALVKNQFFAPTQDFLEREKNEPIEMSKLRYSKLTTYLNSNINSTGAAGVALKTVELFDPELNLLGSVFGILKEYRDDKNDKFLLDTAHNKTANVGLFGFITEKKDKMFFKGTETIVHLGSLKGIVVVTEEFNLDTLNIIKKTVNREIILLKNNKLFLSTFYDNNKNLKNTTITLNDWKNYNEYFETIIQNKKMIYKLIPILSYEGHEIAKLGVGFYLSQIEELYQANIKIFVYLILAFSGVLFILLYFILKNIFLPFNKILENVQKIKEGDYNISSNHLADSEINKIAQSIEELAKTVNDRENTLKDYEAEKQKRIFAENLTEFSKSLSNSVNIKSIFDELINELKKHINFKSNYLFLNEDNNYIVEIENILKPLKLNFNFENGYELLKVFMLFEKKLENIMLIPLKYKNTINSVILLELYDLEINENNVKLTLLLSNHAAFAIENIRLFNDAISNKKLETMVNFSRSIVHEVRTPLVSIMGYAELTKRKVHEAKVLKYMELILKESKRIDEMTKDIIEYANLREISYTIEKINITKVIKNVIKEFELDLQSNRVCLIFNDIENYFCLSNEDKLSKVIKNIIKNSIEALDFNKNDNFIEIQLSKTADKLNISIKDNGVGIKQDNIGKVFDPLFTTKIQGTGLGLTISKGIIDKLNGTIEITSEYGIYTRLDIKLDIQKTNL